MGKPKVAVLTEDDRGLVPLYETILAPVREEYKSRRNEELSLWNEVQIARCLANLDELLNAKKRGVQMFEDTQTSDISSLSRFGFPVVAATLPALAALEIFGLQAQDRKHGAIYYMNYLYDRTKSGITAGDEMFGATNAPNYKYRFTQNHDTYLLGVGNGAETQFDRTMRFIPVIASSVVITATSGSVTLTVTDDGSGNLVGDVGSGTNTIDYTTGEVDVTFSSAPDAGNFYIMYRFNWESNKDNLPKMKIEVTSKGVTAEMRALVASWFLAAAYDLAKAHKMKMEDILASGIAGELKHEIDVHLFQFIYDLAFGTGAAGTVTFNATPATYYPIQEKYREVVKVLNAASNLIMENTGRATGNVVVTGLDLLNILQTCGSDYWDYDVDYRKGSPNGPHRVGVFDKRWVVVANPAYISSKFVVGYKGENPLDCAAVYAPFQPLLIIGPQARAESLQGHLGCLTQSSIASVNDLMVVGGTVTGYS